MKVRSRRRDLFEISELNFVVFKVSWKTSNAQRSLCYAAERGHDNVVRFLVKDIKLQVNWKYKEKDK